MGCTLSIHSLLHHPLQPVATALFANSPFKEGKPTGYLSWRSHVWTDTDPDRCAVATGGGGVLLLVLLRCCSDWLVGVQSQHGPRPVLRSSQSRPPTHRPIQPPAPFCLQLRHAALRF